MRLLKYIKEGSVIQAGFKFHKKKRDDFKDKVMNVVDRFPDEFDKQKGIEADVMAALEYIDKKSKTRSTKFKFPSTLAPYKKNMNPVEEIYYEASNSEDNPNTATKQQLFALDVAKKHSKEITKHLQDDKKKMKNLYSMAKKAIAPQYPKMSIDRKIHEIDSMLRWFKGL